jgi:UrcA family protein
MNSTTIMTRDVSRAVAALAACLFVGAAAIVHAAPANAPRSVTVNYRDLNLTTEAGTQALYARIVSAARSVCEAPDLRRFDEVAAWKECQAQAIENAVRVVDSQRLAAAHLAHQRHG